jgi:hypothetical protein
MSFFALSRPTRHAAAFMFDGTALGTGAQHLMLVLSVQ